MILSLFITIFNGLLNLLPNLPPMPEVIKSVSYLFLDVITDGIAIARLYLTTELLVAMTVIIIALLAFDLGYNAFNWVYKKITSLT